MVDQHRTWETVISNYGTKYVDHNRNQLENVPDIASPLDFGLYDILVRTMADTANLPNGMYVEDLLDDCVRRAQACLTLRQLAFDLEARAMDDVSNLAMQQATFDRQARYDLAIEDVEPYLSGNAIGQSVINASYTNTSMPDHVWKELKKLRLERNNSSINHLERRLVKLTTPGNGSFYSERFTNLKRIFTANIIELYKRCRVTGDYLNAIYRYTERCPEPIKVNFLDELSIWIQRSSNFLDNNLDRRLTTNVAFNICPPDVRTDQSDFDIYSFTSFNDKLPGGDLIFQIDKDIFSKHGWYFPLLRSVKVMVPLTGVNPCLWQMGAVLPEAPLSSGTTRLNLLAPGSFADIPETDVRVMGVHNAPPYGEWRLVIPDRALTGQLRTVANLKTLLLVLRISHEIAP